MSLRRLLNVAALGAAAAVFVYGSTAWLVGKEGLDRCATAASQPSDADGATIERSVLPWRWTCVYRLGDGREVRRTRVLWDGGG